MEQGFDRQHLILCYTSDRLSFDTCLGAHEYVGVKMRVKCVMSEISFL